MDLNRAILLIAQELDQGNSEAVLLEQVRERLLKVAMGDSLPGVAPDQMTAVQGWLQSEMAGADDPFGGLYQRLLKLVLVRTDQGLTVHQEPRAHRATGAYYTDSAIVRYMTARAREFCPHPAAVVDPACGAGAFLSGVHAEYGEGLHRLVGMDSDPHAVEACKRNVPGAQVLQRDVLMDDLQADYDLCLGNPPYISSGLRGTAPADPERQAALRQRFPLAAQYKLTTYPLFVMRGLELLRTGGVLGYILPDSFLTGRFYAGLRAMLLANTLLELTLICSDFWAYGRVGYSVILFLRKGPAPPGHRVQVNVCRGVSDLGTPGVDLSLNDLVWGSLQRFRLVPDARSRAFLQLVESQVGAEPLGRYMKTYSGLIARHGQRSLFRSENPDLAGPWGRLLRSGREINRYWLHWSGEEVSLNLSLIKSGGHLPYYQQPKLLLRQTSDSLRAVYDDQGFYCLNNIHVLVPRTAGVNLRAMLGLLNSQVVNRYYRLLTMESGRVYPQVDLDLLQGIPVPPLSEAASIELATLARARENAAPRGAASIEEQIERLVEGLYRLGPV